MKIRLSIEEELVRKAKASIKSDTFISGSVAVETLLKEVLND